ncbi:glycosyl hydrolase [Christiangramia fulva]|uniref:Glycosyl hydrolase n=1 Tax=Christiangramia fulva TaxID=2126553 RepID=A0A2R3ZB47_9FLAO|nr:glycosyl hydrolase [Christiangramia fulva]
MKRLSLFLLFSLFFIGMYSQDYQLFWHDEFNYHGKPDKEKWNFEKGFIRNLEEQYYTSRRKNARVKDGRLFLTALKEKYRNRNFEAGASNWKYYTHFANYTSASINTKNKFEIKYGRIEVRAKLPAGKGVWPAIWMLGADFDEKGWPNTGEIDIMEHVGKAPDEIHATVHFPYNNSMGYDSKGTMKKINNPAEDFHVYSIDWDENKIDFLIDNEIYHSFRIADAGEENNPFRKPFYLIINLALGGNWAGEVDPEIFPQQFVIDYVRVFTKK